MCIRDSLPSVGKSKCETRNSPQLLRCNHEVDRTWYANPLARGKACGLQPLFVFRFAIACPRPSAHQHVQREQCAEAWRGLVRIEDEVRNDELPMLSLIHI